MVILYAKERFDDAWPEIQAMVFSHWQEVRHKVEPMPKPDVIAYSKACAEQRLALFTVRDEDALIGYGSFWVGPMVYRGNNALAAWQDAIFLRPVVVDPVEFTWRRKLWRFLTRKPLKLRRPPGIGLAFLQFFEAELRKLGCSVIHQSVRKGRDFSPVLKRAGYTLAETVWIKQLAPGV